MTTRRANLTELTELGVVVSGDTGVVHKEVDSVRLLCLQVLRKLDSTLLGRNVTRESVQATRSGVVFLDGALKDVLASARYVDLRTIGYESLCDHEADAGPSSCDDCCDVRDIEQDAGLELVIGTLGGRHGGFLDEWERWS